MSTDPNAVSRVFVQIDGPEDPARDDAAKALSVPITETPPGFCGRETLSFPGSGLTSIDGDAQSVNIYYDDAHRVHVGNHVDETDIGTLEGVKPFRDMEEQLDAIQDRRYKTSPAYRVEVAQRMMVTK